MKAFLTIALAAILGVAAYVFCFRAATAPTTSMLTQPAGELEWLRREFHLTDAQFADVKKMHEEYALKCDAMCGKIAEANERLDQLISTNKSVTPEVQVALNHCMTVQQECRQALLGHIYAVSAEMPPEQGARYIAMMKTRIVEPGVSHRAIISESAK